MIYLLGASGDIGINISNYFNIKGIEYIGVNRKPSKNNIGFINFLKIISRQKNILVINSAKLCIEDLNLFVDSAGFCTRIIHISSVAVYGNSNLSNVVLPINNYGLIKVREEEILKHNFKVFIIRLSNIYGGSPETSGVLKLYNSNNLNYIDIDKNGNEIIRDYIQAQIFLNSICENLNFVNTEVINISSGIGITLSAFFYLNNIDISNVKRKLFDSDSIIKESIIDNFFRSNEI